MELPQRKANRLPDFDYSSPGAYFITMCVEGRKCVLGRVVGDGALDVPSVHLSKTGAIVRRHIVSGNNIPGITVEKFVIMPNHVHLLLFIDGTLLQNISKPSSPANAAIPHFVSTLKRFCHKDIGAVIFQRSYHDHIIRRESDYLKIWQYIDSNPAKWKEDCFYEEEFG